MEERSIMKELQLIAVFFRAKANMYATCASACENVALILDGDSAEQMINTMYAVWKKTTSDEWPI